MSFFPEAVGDGYDFTVNGTKHHCGLITQEVKSKFEKALFANAKAQLAEVKDLLTPEGYQAKADALAETYLAGGFAIVQQDMSKSPLVDPRNTLTLLSLLMGLDEVEMIALAAAAPGELTQVVRCVMKDSFPGYQPDGEQKKTTSTPEETKQSGPS